MIQLKLIASTRQRVEVNGEHQWLFRITMETTFGMLKFFELTSANELLNLIKAIEPLGYRIVK